MKQSRSPSERQPQTLYEALEEFDRCWHVLVIEPVERMLIPVLGGMTRQLAALSRWWDER